MWRWDKIINFITINFKQSQVTLLRDEFIKKKENQMIFKKRSPFFLLQISLRVDDKWSRANRDLLISSLRNIPVVLIFIHIRTLSQSIFKLNKRTDHLDEIYVYIMNSMYLCILYTISHGAIVNSVRLWNYNGTSKDWLWCGRYFDELSKRSPGVALLLNFFSV